MGVDRTAEFLSTVEILIKETGGSLDDVSAPLLEKPANLTSSQFSQAAAHISRGIYQTTAKLEKLTKRECTLPFHVSLF